MSFYIAVRLYSLIICNHQCLRKLALTELTRSYRIRIFPFKVFSSENEHF